MAKKVERITMRGTCRKHPYVIHGNFFYGNILLYFPTNVKCPLCEIADQQEQALIKQLVEALEFAANRLDFLTNWLENTYKGALVDIKLGRGYAKAVRDALAVIQKQKDKE